MVGGGEPAHVQPHLGDDDLRGQRTDPGDLIQALPGRQPPWNLSVLGGAGVLGGLGRGGRTGRRWGRAVGAGRPAVGVVVGSLGGLRLGHRRQQLFGTGGEPLDLGGETIDLIQQDPRELAVVGVEPPSQRLDQGQAFGLHPAPR